MCLLMRTIKNELRETKIKKFNQNREDKDNNRVYTWLDPNHQPQPRRRQHRDYPPRRYDVQETGTSDQHSTDSASSGPIDFLYQRGHGSNLGYEQYEMSIPINGGSRFFIPIKLDLVGCSNSYLIACFISSVTSALLMFC